MVGADNKVIVFIQELMRLKLQWDAKMGAGIFIYMEVAASVYYKQLNAVVVKASAAVCGNVLNRAEWCHCFLPVQVLSKAKCYGVFPCDVNRHQANLF